MESLCKKIQNTHIYVGIFQKYQCRFAERGDCAKYAYRKLLFQFFVKKTNGYQTCASKIILAKIKCHLEKSVWGSDIPVRPISDRSGQQYQLINNRGNGILNLSFGQVDGMAGGE